MMRPRQLLWPWSLLPLPMDGVCGPRRRTCDVSRGVSKSSLEATSADPRHALGAAEHQSRVAVGGRTHVNVLVTTYTL